MFDNENKEFRMEVILDTSGDTVRFKVEGEIDTKSGVELSEKFAEVMENESIYHVVFDFTGVPNITSAGIGKILKLFKFLNSKGGSIRIKGISASLKELFKEIHLDKIIPIEE
ncbi:MAG: STAS domain-containing protein [Spirochaetales bacterium]|nr:STAS domain-containing protein [Spirochaetales bacterium]